MRQIRSAIPDSEKKHVALKLYSALVYLFLFAPIFVVIYMSFNSGKVNIFPIRSFSLQWYESLFHNGPILKSFFVSLLIAFCSTTIVLCVGTCASYVIVRYGIPMKSGFIGLMLAPMLMPAAITGISMLLYYSFLGFKTSMLTVIIGHAVLTLPYATMNITARLQGFNIYQEEAARNLGANELTVFSKIVLPQIKGGLISGALFAFTISMDEFALTFFVNSANSQTLPVRIYSMLRFGLTPELNALSTLILCISFALITIVTTTQMNKKQKER